jgi:hypothetical protein
MARQLARYLVAAGHTVTMLVPFPNRPQGTVYAGYKRRLRHVTDAFELSAVRLG